jgi:hypothetical protein
MSMAATWYCDGAELTLNSNWYVMGRPWFLLGDCLGELESECDASTLLFPETLRVRFCDRAREDV